MPVRRPGAPRLIEWTGERCVPWAPDVQVVYEHYHRYLWARNLIAGLRVLDVGSGEGFGAALLAESAADVTGIDIDEETVEHARLNYGSDSVSFQRASAADLSRFADDSFDAVVALELIEHIADQSAVLAEIRRVLVADGILIISTPDRHAYSTATGNVNPFHEKELSQEEFTQLLGATFPFVTLFGQRVVTGSRIESLSKREGARHLGFNVARYGDEWQETGSASPLYIIAVASAEAIADLPGDSTLSDYELRLMREAERRAALAEGAVEDERRRVGDVLRERDAAVADVQTAVEDERRRAEREVIERERIVSEVATQRDEVAGEVSRLTRALMEAREHAEVLGRRSARIEQSVTWGLIQTARGRFYPAIGGESSFPARAVQALLRLVGGVALSRRAKPALAGPRQFPPLTLPPLTHVDVSIVIPVYSGAELTDRCLRAIVSNSTDVAYEVILVDDTADADTKSLLASIENARVIANERNLGYLRSVNAGVAAARGRHVVLLNNDTEPRAGWLRAMVDRAESGDDVGVVAAKLVFPDGSLQEAGGIVWRDGNPWNYGRGQDPGAPEFNYVRDVDYGSAAALLVRAELWNEVGGFDERFAPGYFEDTDLCFAARAQGWRVVYEPKAVVIHVEGASQGTDVTTGVKRHQAFNQPKFAAKWKHALLDQPGHASPERAQTASNRNRGSAVLIVDHRVPAPDRDSGSLRMKFVLENLVSMGCRVTFVPDDYARVEPYASGLQAMGVEVIYGATDIRAVVADLAPRLRLAILSRPYVAARYLHVVREHAPRAIVAYDTVDLHYLREERRARRSPDGDLGVSRSFRALELGLAKGSDVTLVVTDDERQELQRLDHALHVEVVPNAHRLSDGCPGPAGRDGLLFVGGFQHTPNIDAAVYLAQSIMPLVWSEIEDATLTIAGPDAPPEVTRLAGWGLMSADGFPTSGRFLMRAG
jgi:GT2 family glycosyltransferase/ubiquinone/menaquinone biosynthesis C-methylase UbiE